MPLVTSLADLLAPMEVSQFYATVQGKSYRVFPGERGRFRDLVPWAELDRALRQHRLDYPRLRLALDGQPVPTHTYTELVQTRRAGVVPRLLAAPLAEQLRQGATLVLDSVEELFEPVGELAAALEHEVRERVQVNLYGGWGKTHGFDVHWDDHDAFILQLSGRKRWRVYGPTRPFPLHRDVALPESPAEEPIADFLLEDGDVLYVPRGHWHDVSAVGEESLHLTVGINRATGVDLLAWVADQSRAEESLRADLPRFDGPDARVERAAALRSWVAEFLTDDVVDRFFTDRDAQAPAQSRIGLPWAATSDLIGDRSQVRFLAPRAVLKKEGAAVVLLAAGKRLMFAEAAEPVLTALLDGQPRSVESLTEASQGLPRAVVRALVGELVTNGLVAPE